MIKRKIATGFLLALSFSAGAGPSPKQSGVESWPKIKSAIVQDPAMEARISEIMKSMSLAEKVGQMVQGEIQHVTAEDVKAFHLGSVLNGGGSFPGGDKQAQVSDWLALADQYWAASMDESDGNMGIPILWGTDAVHGHNNVRGATLFPHNIGLGAARDPDLMEKIGEITAREVAATGIDWTFAPTLAVVRDDRWGRSYEGYAESPDLVEDYAGRMVKGLQGSLELGRVIATAKHFIGDGGTNLGKDQGNTEVSEAELRDIHGRGYFPALAAGVQSVMITFNSWNGEKVHGYKYLIQDVLKDRMGFDGLVVSDWNGIGQVKGCSNSDCAQAVLAGIDLFMIPYKAEWRPFIENTIAQVQGGKIPMSRIDDAVRRILRVKMRAGLFDRPKPSQRLADTAQVTAGTVGATEHKNVAREAVRKSLVLLKNNRNLLPIPRSARVLVAGKSADSEANQTGGWTLSWQGTENSKDDYVGVTTVLDAIRSVSTSVTFDQDGSEINRKSHDVAIVVIGETPYAEGRGDLGAADTLELAKLHPEDLEVLKRVKASGVPAVAIYLGGRPLYANKEINLSDAFVAAWLPGSEAEGITDVIFQGPEGGVNYDFTGKLSFSWPQEPCQTPLNVGEKAYDPLFPYGFGLEYGKSSTLAKLPEPSRDFGCGQDSSSPVQDEVRVHDEGQTQEPWGMFIGDPLNDWLGIQVRADEVSTPSIVVTPVDNEEGIQWAARQLVFKGLGQVYFQSLDGAGRNLETFAEAGKLSFQAKLPEVPAADVQLRIDCVYPCIGSIDLTPRLNEIAGKGWQTVTVPLSEFDGVKWNRVDTPFLITTSDALTITIDKVMWEKG
ncbi:glycoside hydrolase family 3 protein [Pseudobacteriovorax antillogorgiicola]|uniref:Exo-1,4-beta-glucosidase n=1 Tax=Pseudobacteriovorax antillogorgiicola TaxID=1513793 RepID=A0A1Y6CFA5_9BACT|nr:glycoside hydrolase family 3 protein [Pseudobacteriovorax antillogorgiicola]TCS47986.1 exo-1,4-beta-glucosidase [Pseudobacteriovorax antillogorgiicola]SMF58283.1 exo-1,4-beta-glucosidase [Pseudobacteriovorax antillogorgiicola]